MLFLLFALVSAQDFPYTIRQKTLPNGLKVVVVNTGMPGLISLQIPVSTGSRQEVEPGHTGFAHFFEHMMFRGTKNVSQAQWKQALLQTGASQNAYTSDDLTNYHTLFGKQDLEKWLQLEGDRFQNLEYSVDDFKTESRAVLGEYNKNSANPVQKLIETVRDRAYTTHTYKHTTMGFLKDIEDMPNQFDYSKDFFARWYRPDNATVILVGDVAPDKAFPLVEKYFGGWKKRSAEVPKIPAEPPHTAPIDLHVPWASDTSPWVMVAFHTPAKFSTTDKKGAALALVGDMYFGGESALYDRLVVREQKVSELMVFGGNAKDPSLFMIGAQLKKVEDIAAVRDAILDTCAEARRLDLSEHRVSEAKEKARLAFVRRLDSANAIAGVLARLTAFDRDPEAINKVSKLRESITLADLAVARDTFSDHNRIIATLAKGDVAATAYASIAEREKQAPADVLVVDERNEQAPLATIRLQLRVGSIHDPQGHEGVAEVSAAMVSDAATQQRGYSEVKKAWASLGGGPSVVTDKERTTFAITVPAEKAEAAADLLLEQFLAPALNNEDFQRLRGQTVVELQTELKGNNDEELGKVALEWAMYEGPYAHPVLGTKQTLDALTVADVRRFIGTYYVQDKLVVGFAGAISQTLKDRVLRRLGHLSSAKSPKVSVREAEHRSGGSALYIVTKDTRATAISFGFSLRERDGNATPVDARVNRGHPDFAALWVATSYLGQHRNSTGRLYQELREKRGLNYGDYAYLEAFPGGMFSFQPAPGVARWFNHWQGWLRPLKPENAAFALRGAVREIARVRDHGLTADEFDASRGYLVRFLDHLTDTDSKRLGHDLDNAAMGLKPYAETLRPALQALTLQQVNAAAKKYLKAQDLDIVVVTKDAAAFQRDLANTPKPVYDAPKPQLAADDEAIAGYALDIKKTKVIPLDTIP